MRANLVTRSLAAAALSLGLEALFIGELSPASAAMKFDQMPPVLQDLVCANNPTLPQCREKCPPYCLGQQQDNIRRFQSDVLSRARGAGIVIRQSGGGVILQNKGGKSASIECDAMPLRQAEKRSNTAKLLVRCTGAVGGQVHQWESTYPLDKSLSREGALKFRRFIAAASSAFPQEMQALGGGSSAQGPEGADLVFCGVAAGAATVLGSPVAGGAVMGLCSWFASNGID